MTGAISWTGAASRRSGHMRMKFGEDSNYDTILMLKILEPNTKTAQEKIGRRKNLNAHEELEIWRHEITMVERVK